MMLLLVCLLVFTTTNTLAEECIVTKTADLSILVYYGWPVSYNCHDLIYEIYYYPAELDDHGEYTCVISETLTGKTIFNSSFSTSNEDFYLVPIEEVEYRFDNITTETPTNYNIKIQRASYCWEGSLTLKPRYVVQESCEENLEHTSKIHHEKAVGSHFQGSCDVPVDGGIPLELLPSDAVAKIYWLYNCNTVLPNNTRLEPDKSLVTQNFYVVNLFQDISYELNPGIYTCVVEYNNMTRYRIHREICVEVPVSKQTTISCDDETAEIGSGVEIQCHVDAGLGIENEFVLSGRINKLNATGEAVESNSTCFSRASDVQRKSPNGRGSCNLTTLNRGENDVTCFYRQPTEEELEKQRTTLSFTFKITNVRESDFGSYVVTITRAGNTATKTIELTQSRISDLVKTHSTLIIIIPVVVGVSLIIAAVCVLCRVELRWFCFRMFADKETDVKNYCAYLAYYYCQDMPQTDPKQLKKFVMDLIPKLQQSGGKVFNNCEEQSNEQYNIGSIMSKLSECHRVVILLTPEYINDRWGVFEAAEAWKSVIEQGTKIVFISFSDTKSTIKNLEEKPRNFLQSALKHHKVIYWNGNLPLSKRFCMQLEMNMPKLPENRHVEMLPPINKNTKLPMMKTIGNEEIVYTNTQVDNNGNVYENICIDQI